MTRFHLAITAAALCFTLLPAQAQTKRAPAEVTVSNARAANVTGLALTNAEGASLGGIAKPIASGKSMKIKLAKGAPCTLTVEASFDDETTSGPDQVDVCADKTIRFTD